MMRFLEFQLCAEFLTDLSAQEFLPDWLLLCAQICTHAQFPLSH
jgi:hypothetical protein